jgi:prepilin-type N-terminal cleavage/methylation domain-containing protein
MVRTNQRRLRLAPNAFYFVSGNALAAGSVSQFSRTNHRRLAPCRSPNTQFGNRARLRAAFTLIELLIVIGIATVLASLSLSTVRGLLKDQKITQAARMAKQYIDTARTRAMSNGRPVALFLERTSVAGISGAVTEANYTVTRLSIGEVFPPYTGETTGALATLWDVVPDLPAAPIAATKFPLSRGATDLVGSPIGDGFADQARFILADVVSAFGTASSPGMVSVGDTIEFVGNIQRFVIESIDFVPAGAPTQVAVTFFNPPTTYDAILADRFRTKAARNTKFEVSYSGREPTLRTSNTVTGLLGPSGSAPSAVPFRIYRKPTKSLVGTIAMPRGTCIDLSVSGIGPSSTAADSTNPFHLTASPDSVVPTAEQLQPSSFSRIAIVFNAEGRANGLFRDDRIVSLNGTAPVVRTTFTPFGLSSALHLLVGRTEQVLPSAPLSAPIEAGKDDPRGNVMDGGNTWISIHPFTGAIESSPVAPVSATTLGPAVFQARAFAIRGVNDGGR